MGSAQKAQTVRVAQSARWRKRCVRDAHVARVPDMRPIWGLVVALLVASESSAKPTRRDPNERCCCVLRLDFGLNFTIGSGCRTGLVFDGGGAGTDPADWRRSSGPAGDLELCDAHDARAPRAVQGQALSHRRSGSHNILRIDGARSRTIILVERSVRASLSGICTGCCLIRTAASVQ